MALTDFLFNGSPPASTTTYGSTTSSLPAWYNDYTQGLISKANAIAATPYQPYTGARLADIQQPQQQAWQNIGAQTGAFANQFDPTTGGIAQGKAFNPAYSAINEATQGNILRDTGAGDIYNKALAPGIQNQFVDAANATRDATYAPATSNLDQYFNPYQNAVGSEINRRGAENLNNAINAVGDKYVGSGQWGGSRMGVGLGNAIRQSQADLSGQQSALAQQGYNQALATRQADLQRQLAGAQQLGGLAATQQQNLANLANQIGQFGSADLQRKLQGGQNLGQLAQTAAQTGTSQNAALEASGQSQQQQLQRSLDLAYQDWQNQLQYPYQQASFLNNVIRGLQIPTAQNVSQTGPASVYQPSPLSQLAAAGTGLAGLGKLFG